MTTIGRKAQRSCMFSIEHLRPKEPGCGPPWFTTWTGERFDSDDLEALIKHERLAHQALDRSYPNPFPQTRLLLARKVITETVIIVPAMWETPL